MATIYGATIVTSPNNPTNTDGGRILGDNSEVFTANDLVTAEIGSGTLAVAGATDPIYGIVLKTQTMASDNESVAKIRPICFTVDQQYELLMGTNADLAEANLGDYFKLTGATGAQQVDVASGAQTGTSRIVMLTKIDPNGLGGTGAGSGLRQGLFKVVKPSDIRQIAPSS
jgi:hypothetical protein